MTVRVSANEETRKERGWIFTRGIRRIILYILKYYVHVLTCYLINEYGRHVRSHTVNISLFTFSFCIFIIICIFLVFSVHFDLFIFSPVASKFPIFILHSLVMMKVFHLNLVFFYLIVFYFVFTQSFISVCRHIQSVLTFRLTLVGL